VKKKKKTKAHRHWPGCYPAVCRAVAGLTDCDGTCLQCGAETCGAERFQAWADKKPAPCLLGGHR
jgi:hypothetical protein